MGSDNGLKPIKRTPEELANATDKELVEWFMPLARRIASHLCPDDPDALQDAYLGLALAVQSFDARKGAFHTWAKPYVRQTVIRGRDARRNMLRISSRTLGHLGKMLAYKEQAALEGRLDITPAEIAEECDMPLDVVEELMTLPRVVNTISQRNGQQDNRDEPGSEDAEMRAVDARMLLAEHLREHPVFAKKVEDWQENDGTEAGLRSLRREWKKMQEQDDSNQMSLL